MRAGVAGWSRPKAPSSPWINMLSLMTSGPSLVTGTSAQSSAQANKAICSQCQPVQHISQIPASLEALSWRHYPGSRGRKRDSFGSWQMCFCLMTCHSGLHTSLSLLGSLFSDCCDNRREFLPRVHRAQGRSVYFIGLWRYSVGILISLLYTEQRAVEGSRHREK